MRKGDLLNVKLTGKAVGSVDYEPLRLTVIERDQRGVKAWPVFDAESTGQRVVPEDDDDLMAVGRRPLPARVFLRLERV